MRDKKGRFIKGNKKIKHKDKCICFICLGISFNKGRNLKWRQNENNHNWKGDNAGYTAIHTWIYRKYGKATICSNNANHHSPRFHWANISGEYKRDISDWRQLCPSCNLRDGVKIPEKFRMETR